MQMIFMSLSIPQPVKTLASSTPRVRLVIATQDTMAITAKMKRPVTSLIKKNHCTSIMNFDPPLKESNAFDVSAEITWTDINGIDEYGKNGIYEAYTHLLLVEFNPVNKNPLNLS